MIGDDKDIYSLLKCCENREYTKKHDSIVLKLVFMTL